MFHPLTDNRPASAPPDEQEYEATVTILVKVKAKNAAHATKIIEGGVTLALNVVPLASHIDLQG
jgi:hypothetical protein